jgi:hypothetical protein
MESSPLPVLAQCLRLLAVKLDHNLEPPHMSLPQRYHDKAKQDEVSPDLVELATLVTALPAEFRSRLEPVVTRVFESTKRRRRILNLVQEALSQLRLDMKYLVFDLEATRRERDDLKAQRDGNEEN